MSELVADCPRCDAKSITFDLTAELFIGEEYEWLRWYEVFCVCRKCKRSTVFVVKQLNYEDTDTLKSKGLLNLKDAVNRVMEVDHYISLTNLAVKIPPKHLPSGVEASFMEAATCFTVGCWNATGAMARMCLDLATRPLPPAKS